MEIWYSFNWNKIFFEQELKVQLAVEQLVTLANTSNASGFRFVKERKLPSETMAEAKKAQNVKLNRRAKKKKKKIFDEDELNHFLSNMVTGVCKCWWGAFFFLSLFLFFAAEDTRNTCKREITNKTMVQVSHFYSVSLSSLFFLLFVF